MAYRPERDTPRDRVRAVAGDTKDPPTLRGGEVSYDAILAGAPSEHIAAQRACRDLAAQISKQPDSLGDAGSSLAWRERVPYLLAVAGGTIATGLAGDPTLAAAYADSAAAGSTETKAVW
jgi:hypothetical protein